MKEDSDPIWTEAPCDLRDDLLPVKPFTQEMLPQPVNDWVFDYADRMQSSPEFFAVPIIISAGSIIGTDCCIYPKKIDVSWNEFPNLWGIIIGDPGVLKTPSAKVALKPINHMQELANKSYEDSYKLYKKELAEIKAKSKNSIEPDLPEPHHLRFITQDITKEKLADILVQNNRPLLIQRDELIGLFKTIDLPTNAGFRSLLCEGWSVIKNHHVDRISRGSSCIPLLALSIFGCANPGPLTDYIADAVKEGVRNDGFIQRFQIMVWPDALPTFEDIDREPIIPDSEMFKIFYSLIRSTPKGGAIYAKLKGDPPGLHFADDAQELFKSFRINLETSLRSGNLPPVLVSHVAKYRKLIPALALIFHMIDIVLGHSEFGPVSMKALECAMLWQKFLMYHARRVYMSYSASSPEHKVARDLINLIKKGSIIDGMTVRDLNRKQWSGLTDSKTTMDGLKVLVEHNWIRLDQRRDQNGGLPSFSIRLNPKIVMD